MSQVHACWFMQILIFIQVTNLNTKPYCKWIQQVISITSVASLSRLATGLPKTLQLWTETDLDASTENDWWIFTFLLSMKKIKKTVRKREQVDNIKTFKFIWFCWKNAILIWISLSLHRNAYRICNFMQRVLVYCKEKYSYKTYF